MAKIGYRRVSSAEQNFERQQLEGCDKIFEEKISGAARDRLALAELIAWAREGDEVVVWSIDRLARDLRDLQEIVATLNAKGVKVSFVSERLSFSADKSDAFAMLHLQLLGAFAQFERSIIRKRQQEGIERAKLKGVYKGRKATIDCNRVKALKALGKGGTEIARELGIGRASVYRMLGETLTSTA